MKNLSTWFKIFALIGLSLNVGIVSINGLSVVTIAQVSVVSSVWITACYVPQLIKLVRTRNADGISLDFWLNLDIALLALTISTGTIYVLYGTIGAFITEIANLVFALAVTVLVFVIQLKDSKKENL